MRFIADLHIHSHYSRATSPVMNITALSKWSQLKGTRVMGTGDFTHPKWFAEMREKLEPAEPGLFRLKAPYEKESAADVPDSCKADMRFLLSAEVATVYKKAGKVRKIHNLLYAPSFEVAAKINATLEEIGNIAYDGRPIIGLDTKELLKIVLAASPDAMLIPAHAWTPHFGVFGSGSGFDSLEECFDELASEIFSIETGLSSDPAMNWQVEALDRIAFTSNSDAHSAEKLGREANVFNTELSYFALRDALRTNDLKAFEKTIEFFPEEGKYHLDGHRACGVVMTPEESKPRNFICPACKKPMTIGVLHRVSDLADHPVGRKPKWARPFQNIIPLPELLAEVEGTRPQSKKVAARYHDLLRKLGNEFYVLLEAPLLDIETASNILVAEAIRKMRKGDISIAPGYDGEYGHISVWRDGTRPSIDTLATQTKLF